MTDSNRTSEQLFSELISEAIRPAAGAVGVIVRDVISPDPKVLLERLTALPTEEAFPDLRIAYLLQGGQEAAKEIGIGDDMFTIEVEQAERWRNERNLEALIVVIAHGNEAKLSSLEDFVTVTSQDLKNLLFKRALGGPAGENDPQALLWQILAQDHAVGLGQFAEYYLSLENIDNAEFKIASSQELHRVGLLPDPVLFDDPRPAAIRMRLQSNREILERLQMLTPKDRRTIKQSIEDETDSERKSAMLDGLKQLRRSRTNSGPMGFVEYEQARELLKLRQRIALQGVRKTRERSVDVAATALVNPNRVDDLKVLSKNLKRTLKQLQHSSVRTETIRTPLPASSTEAISTARLDVMNLMAKVLDKEHYGGLIVQSDLDEIDDLLRRFNTHEHLQQKTSHDRIRKPLEHIAESIECGRSVTKHFDTYNIARNDILQFHKTLTIEPLVVAADPEARKKALAVVRTYEHLIQSIQEHYDEIFETVGADIDEFVGLLLLMDIIIVKGRERLFAILSPVHPLYLWHYAKYADVVDTQREELGDRDQELVADAARHLPNFLTSLYIPPTALGQGKSLSYVGRLGQLPYYSDSPRRSDGDDGIETISELIKCYVDVEPYARHGLRIALVDPPNAGPYLREIVRLFDENKLEGAHLVVYRHQDEPLSVELRLDASDEDMVAQVFNAINRDRRFTFEVRDRRLADDFGPREGELFHVAVVFDKSEGRTARTKQAAHPIQPLAVPRQIEYSGTRETVELVPSSGGPFKSYRGLVNRVAEGGGQGDYLSVHQQDDMRDTLCDLADRVAWTIFADKHIDRDLAIGALRIYTGREGERDIAAFARSPVGFRRPLREVVRRYNTFITDEELDSLLQQLSDLLDSGLHNIRPDRNGKVDHNRIKGLLATLIAACWYRNGAEPEARLLISLDSPDARRWMHLSGDPLYADLVGFEWTSDHCTITVIEVKAVEASDSEYKIEQGTGIVTGPAIKQMLATRRLLERILNQQRENELITTPARREILLEHFYRELTKGTYTAAERMRWSDRLQRLLNGKVTTDVRCHLIDVRLGQATSTLRNQSVVAKDGEESVPTRVSQLNEEIIGLRTAPQPSSGEESEDVQPSGNGAADSKQPALGKGATVAPDLKPRLPTSDETDVAVGKLPHQPPELRPEIETVLKVDRLRALIGTAPGNYGKPQEVWFDPHLPGQQLSNPHISITGETGSGKTQATKTIVSALRKQDVPALILDFKDDYSSQLFLESERFRLCDAGFEALPLNPLIPAVDRHNGLINPSQHIYYVSDIVKRIYGLGDQQAFQLREAIKRAFEQAGLSMDAGPLPEELSFPAFDAVQRELSNDKANERLLGRLSPIFDLGLFNSDAGQSGFQKFFESSTVIRLGQLPGDEIKNSVAEFFLMALYNHLIRQSQKHVLGRLLVVDEAWRVMESRFLTPLMREGRAFGLGVVIASQLPRDLPEHVRGSTATRLFFGQSQVEQIREIQKTTVGKTSGPEAEHVAGVLRGLTPLSCVLHNSQYKSIVRVTIDPYFRRHLPDETT